MNRLKKYVLIMTMTSLGGSAASAAPVTWGGPSGMSVMTNPNAMSVVNSTILAPQASELQTAASNKAAAAAAAAQPTAAQTEANLFASSFSQSAFDALAQKAQGGTAGSGQENLGNGETLIWGPDGSGGTTVSLTGPGGSVTTIDVPTL